MRVRGFLLVAVVAALALLAAACGGGGDESTSTATSTPSAGDGADLTADQAIQRVLDMLEKAPDQRADPSMATARRMTECEAHEMMRWEGAPRGRPPTPPSERPVWLVEIRGEFSGFIGYGLTPDPSPPRAGTWIQILGDGGAGGILFDEREEGPELPREDIVERALDEMGISSENRPDASTVTLTRATFREALQTLRRAGAPRDFSERAGPDGPVWLFEVRGQFVGMCPGPPRPGRYFLVLGPDGSVQSSGFIPGAAPTP